MFCLCDTDGITELVLASGADMNPYHTPCGTLLPFFASALCMFQTKTKTVLTVDILSEAENFKC